MNTIKKISILTILCASAITGVGQIANPVKLKNDLHQYLTISHIKRSFSGELLVAKEDNVIYREAVALASVENSLPIKTGANYRIASITKTFTATLISMAQEEKRLNVNDKAILYIKGLSDKFKDITIYQLLTHTSGIPHNDAIKDYWLVKSKLQLDTKQIIAEINTTSLRFQPGSSWHYSSLGYYLLATILENVYQDEYRSILEKKILGRLHMTESGADYSLKIIPRMTEGYHLINDDSLVMAPYRNYAMLKGAGDMHATADDLLKWIRSFYASDLLTAKSKELLFTPAVIQNPLGKKYGYGWFIKNEKPIKYFHGGGTWGYSSCIIFYPEEKVSIIILSNVSTLAVESIAEDLEKIIFGLPFTLPTMETVGQNNAHDLSLYSGTFVSDSGEMKLTILDNKDGLFMQLQGNPPFQIYPKGNHRFFGKKVEIEIEFENQMDEIIGLKAERMGRSFHFKKN